MMVHMAFNSTTDLAHDKRVSPDTSQSQPAADSEIVRAPVVDLIDFNFVDFPPREMILDPVLSTSALMEVAGFRGVGKTYIGLSMAACIATGEGFLKWKAPSPRRVLYIDGEMAANELQERTKAITEAFGIPERGYFKIWTPDIAQRVPDLSTAEGQAMIEPWLKDVEVVFIDSISTLCRTGVEDRAEDWTPIQDWLLRLKRRGISTVLFHHTGWNTDRGRGTSKREDVLNTVVLLKALEDSGNGETKFEVRLTKKRGVHGRAATPIQAQFCIRDGKIEWTYIECVDADMDLAVELSQSGMTQRDIARELGISVGKVNKLLKRRDAINSQHS